MEGTRNRAWEVWLQQLLLGVDLEVDRMLEAAELGSLGGLAPPVQEAMGAPCVCAGRWTAYVATSLALSGIHAAELAHDIVASFTHGVLVLRNREVEM